MAEEDQGRKGIGVKADGTEVVLDPGLCEMMQQMLETGGIVQDEELRREEFQPDFPLVVQIPKIVDTKIRTHKRVMDAYFPQFVGHELGLLPVFGESRPTSLLDARLYPQEIMMGGVHYESDVVDEMFKELNPTLIHMPDSPKRIPNGSIHFHGGIGMTGPSGGGLFTDLEDYEKMTRRNINFQNLYGWVEVTDEFLRMSSEDKVREALGNHDNINRYLLDDKDAVLLIGDEGATGKAYFKVRYGYSIFMIYNDNPIPWVGIGKFKKYCFEGGPEEYTLLTEEDGVRVEFVDEDTGILFYEHEIIQELEAKVKGLKRYQPRRSTPAYDLFRAVITSSVDRRGSVVETIEDMLPVSAEEFVALLGEFSRLSEADSMDPRVHAIRQVYDMFSDVFNPKGNYDDEFERAVGMLRGISPLYDSAKNMEEDEEGKIDEDEYLGRDE